MPADDGARKRAPKPLVAFQGELGAYSEVAIRRFFADGAEPLACRDFNAVGRAVVDGEAAFGLLPVENSLAGSVVASYDVLGALDLAVIGEVISPIHHLVLGLPGARLAELRRVLSHPVALAQCTGLFVEHPEIEAVSYYDTAGAAKAVAAAGDRAAGAIAGQPAAERYGLDVLASRVEDRPDNQTRFLVVARTGQEAPCHGQRSATSWKTTLLLETANTPGALVQVLLPFADRGVNLSKLESRPGEQPWSYRFFVEVEGRAGEAPTSEAITEARERSENLRLLGSYPRWLG